MKIEKAIAYELNIPFAESFAHSAKDRAASDSVVLKVISDDGVVGYGEGVARPYVTGETVESLIEQASRRFWPAVKNAVFFPIKADSSALDILNQIDGRLPDHDGQIIAWNGTRCAFEMAILDCMLKSGRRSLSQFLPPKRDSVIYSGVVPTGSDQKILRIANYYRAMGLKQIKVKVGDEKDIDRVKRVRDILGPDVSLRVDANGAYDFNQAVEKLGALAKLGVVCAEQPLPRNLSSQLPKLKKRSPIPIMVDESLVTLDDARRLIEENACDYFNLRVAKCGGLFNTLQLADLAVKSGVRLQVGAQVGETALLSAVGRCVAAHLDRVEYVEGSFGTMLLTEDIAAGKVAFGPGGLAPVLRGEGLGVHVLDDCLRKYARQIVECGKIRS